MTQTLEQGDPGAVAHPVDRPIYGFFPTTTGADPNRIDGAASIDGVTATAVLRVPLPRAAKVAIRVLLTAIRITPPAPVEGLTAEIVYSIRVDAAGAVTIDASTVTALQQDAAYNVTAVAVGDLLEIRFAGLVGETYRAAASGWAIGVRQ
jgi:hypothetical protein